MKRLIFAGLVMALFTGTTAFAQSNGSYEDDVYYNGSQAQKDAKAEAKKQKKQQTAQQGDGEYYNSSNSSDGGYDGNAQVYNNSYGNDDDSYIDYDDDSYTSRIRRFYYPMASVGYWGGVYSPFWYDPFYSNPYYGWGNWYTPGFSVGIGWGWGGGPYWSNCWGMNTWYGYGGFNSWYNPYYGGGWGWGGGGYWNGYYAGVNDGRYSSYGRSVNYGPRGARNGMMNAGAYGRASNMRAMNVNGNGTVMQPMNGRAGNNAATRNNAINLNGNTINRGGMQVEEQRGNRAIGNQRVFDNNQAIRLNEGRTMEAGQARSMERQGAVQQDAAPARRNGGFFGNMFRGNAEGVNRSGGMERSQQPSRNYNVERAQPSRSYNVERAQPSRSFSSPSPARSSGGFNGGGGARMSGGRR